MTACNMSIEGGARVGYVNPDKKTFEYLKRRAYSPNEDDWETADENGYQHHPTQTAIMMMW